MNTSQSPLNCQSAKDIDIVGYLADMGYHPVKIRGCNYWYCSPLREENTASFKVDRHRNRWIDFGDGSKGNLVDFGIRYHQCTVKDFLHDLQQNHPMVSTPVVSIQSASPLIILQTKTLQSISLIRYVLKRNISVHVAKKYCEEIHYQVNEKKYSAIGFRNDLGGYELRNEWFKGCSSPKHFTRINNNCSEAMVFEGFFDMLTMSSIDPQTSKDLIVLNSLSMVQKAMPVLERYKRIQLYLDNNPAGQKCRDQLISLSKKYEDGSSLYKGYNDLNEWACQQGKRPRLTGQKIIIP
jgi:hypothetical protein